MGTNFGAKPDIESILGPMGENTIEVWCIVPRLDFENERRDLATAFTIDLAS